MTNQFARKLSMFFYLMFVSTLLTTNFYSQNMFRKINDFDGDGKADYAVTRNQGGYKYWYVWKSASGPDVFQFGLDTDVNTAGDYDGDGKTDYSVYRLYIAPPYNSYIHQFYFNSSINNSLNGNILYYDSNTGIQPFQQDFNGDGKTEGALRVERPGESPFIVSLDISVFRIRQYNTGNIPVRVGDVTGDGKSDIVSYNSFNTVSIKNYATENLQSVQFGTTGDEYVPADFDGDGKGDLTIWRPTDGTWWWIRSSDGIVNVVKWGQSGDSPVPADYDGDGKTDLAIWRPGAQSYYWILGSRDGMMVVPWGTTFDQPVTY